MLKYIGQYILSVICLVSLLIIPVLIYKLLLLLGIEEGPSAIMMFYMTLVLVVLSIVTVYKIFNYD